MSADKQVVIPVEASSEVSAEQVTNLVRTHVAERIAQGQQPHDLTFALTFVATEMGLFFTQGRSPLPVFQNVLQGVLCAVTAAARDANGSEEGDCAEEPTAVQPKSNLH